MSGSVGGIVACVRCRTPFHIGERQALTTAGTGPPHNECRKCTANTEKYGPPSACEHCGLLAAYTGTKCRRCFAATVKWGSPVPCCRCARVCAFQRPDLSTGETAASPLCFVCSLAKHRQTLITGGTKHFMAKLRAATAGTETPHINNDNHINRPSLGRIMDNYGPTRIKIVEVNDIHDNGENATLSDDSDVPMDF